MRHDLCGFADLRLKHTRLARWHFEAVGGWDRVVGLYRRATELEPLGESYLPGADGFCRAGQGSARRAIQVFRHRRQTLSVVLNVKLTAETEAVYQSLARLNITHCNDVGDSFSKFVLYSEAKEIAPRVHGGCRRYQVFE
jgi:hypothetical protein